MHVNHRALAAKSAHITGTVTDVSTPMTIDVAGAHRGLRPVARAGRGWWPEGDHPPGKDKGELLVSADAGQWWLS